MLHIVICFLERAPEGIGPEACGTRKKPEFHGGHVSDNPKD